MTERTALINAIRRAIANGWTFKDWTDADDFHWRVHETDDSDSRIVIETESALGDYTWHPWIIIFNHDFAKALWSKEIIEFNIDDATTSVDGPQPFMGGTADYPYNEGAGMDFKFPAYIYHLQQMVIADDPIKYLGENI